MEFLIEMKKMKPGVKLKSIEAEDLYDAVSKIIITLLRFCADDPFTYRVKPIIRNTGMIEFYLFFDTREQKILVYDPEKYSDSSACRRMDIRKK